MNRSRILSLISILLGSCIDPFSIPVSQTQVQLVVEGMITDQPGPYTVKLFKTKPINDQISNSLDVTGAVVEIVDNDGVSEKLKEIAPGNYATSATGMQGTIGKTYTLKITTPEGTQYASEPEPLVAVGDIRKLYNEFDIVEPIPPKYALTTNNGFQIYVDADVLPEQGGRVRWRTTKTFEIRTYPAQRQKYVALRSGAVVLQPDPPECSGWTYTTQKGLQDVKGKCDCCECWITDYSSVPILSNQNFVTDNAQLKVPIDFIPASRRIFNQKCYILVEQMSISENVYNFWEKISKQKKTSSDLFQTPLPNTRGNINAISPNAIPALGIFSASAIKIKTMTISRTEIPYFVPGMDTIKDSCLGVYKVATSTKPPFW
jgi:hypothetical protein